ncbi:tripartite tricarboxylate transporter substrate binding protein [Pseudolabrys sp. FHR47]|uniref:Bug family tripartite tricarboxylate transporter substrate binding protein n=1 Tax=Pseudolabrys sp. FHR47 TaxID=2562284 RepID=UPI0010BF1689|nr:tripartite tricarboxylate transporter substrate binding protein [Pseudolabrys sp. FHR47]
MHQFTRRQLLATASAFAAALSANRVAFAADWPDRPVTIVVPFPPGGSNDVIARIFAQHFSQKFGKTFVVENRAGANGNIGANTVARAAPDGYTLLLSGNGQNAMNHGLYAQMPYDSRKDFTHIAQMGSIANGLFVTANFPAKTLKEFIELAKSKPGQVACASPGSGSSGHLAMAMLQHTTGIKLQHIPYRGAAPAINDVLGGQVGSVMINVDIPLQHVRAGTLRALAVTSSERNSLYSDVPTIAESGFPGFSATGWMGLSGPANLPRNIADQLNSAVNEALEGAQLKERFAAAGYVKGGGSSEQYTSFVSAEIDKWGKVIKDTGASVD